MAVIFNGKVVPGICLAMTPDPPALTTKRQTFFGLDGVVETVGGVNGRKIMVQMVVFSRDWTTAGKLVAYLRELDSARAVGANGTLEDTGSAPQKFGDCTFEGFQRTGRILPDVAGTLGVGTGRWWTEGILAFWQNATG